MYIAIENDRCELRHFWGRTATKSIFMLVSKSNITAAPRANIDDIDEKKYMSIYVTGILLFHAFLFRIARTKGGLRQIGQFCPFVTNDQSFCFSQVPAVLQQKRLTFSSSKCHWDIYFVQALVCIHSSTYVTYNFFFVHSSSSNQLSHVAVRIKSSRLIFMRVSIKSGKEVRSRVREREFETQRLFCRFFKA